MTVIDDIPGVISKAKVNIFISISYLIAHSCIGLFSAPTRVLFIVAPTNILLNYLLGKLVRQPRKPVTDCVQYGALQRLD
jgi:hypothetical protein